MITGTSIKSSGFSMIEVLVSLLIIVIGVLGMAGLQSKAVPYTQDSVLRNNAIMLADDLIELIRSSSFDGTSNYKSFQKPVGSAFPTPQVSCVPTPASIPDRLGCWAAQAATMLPTTPTQLLNSFYICWSATPGDANAAICPGGSEVEIQLAWTVKPGACLDGSSTATTCTYKIRTRL
ncbi:MAG: type IV pilus modification protein PilV [Pseudomonas sp.]